MKVSLYPNNDVSKETYREAFSEIMDHLKQDIARLPNLPGVYYFYRDETLLYVGKSIDIKARVLSHCYAIKSDPKEHRLVTSANQIVAIVTGGELSALLLESREIKEKKPLYNRRLRRKVDLLSWQFCFPRHPEPQLASHVWPPVDGVAQYGLYRNRFKAVEGLKKLVREQGLCERRMGLDRRSKGPCFAHQLKRCGGVCVNRESPESHDQRLVQALNDRVDIHWPFEGAVAIEIALPDTHKKKARQVQNQSYCVVDRWFLCGEATSLADARLLASETRKSSKGGKETAHARLLDLDEYRIVLSYLRKHRDTGQIHVL